MAFMFSQACQHALRAIIFLASHGTEKYVSIKSIAERLELPGFSLAKIFQKLAKAGILESVKGPNGGFRLAGNANDIFLIRIVDAIDGCGILNKCMLEIRDCSEETPCAIHDCGKEVREKLRMMLENYSIGDLIAARSARPILKSQFPAKDAHRYEQGSAPPNILYKISKKNLKRRKSGPALFPE